MTRFSRTAPIAAAIGVAAVLGGGTLAALTVGAGGNHSALTRPYRSDLGSPVWKCGDAPQQWGPIYYVAAAGTPTSNSSRAGSELLREAVVRRLNRSRATRKEVVMWYGKGGPIGGSTRAEHIMAAAAGTQPMPVYPVSSNPSLCTTDRKLSDQAAAQRLMSSAQAALVAAGLASREQLNGEGTAYMVSDDPLDSGQAIITADVPIPSSACPSSLPNGGTCYGARSLLAFVRLSDAVVTGVATGPSQ